MTQAKPTPPDCTNLDKEDSDCLERNLPEEECCQSCKDFVARGARFINEGEGY